jgi:hypothetical protein
MESQDRASQSRCSGQVALDPRQSVLWVSPAQEGWAQCGLHGCRGWPCIELTVASPLLGLLGPNMHPDAGTGVGLVLAYIFIQT